MRNVNTTFTRTAANIEKMGAYYTDVEHCRQIGKMFKWPENAEVSVLEPSIGDGSAVRAVTDAEKNPNIRIFGVELNDEVASQLKSDPGFEAILKADFLTGVRIKNSAFSFVFGNPPYMEDDLGGTGERMELSFLKKVVNYLGRDGVIVWVIPYRVFVEDSFFRFWTTRFETLGVYKFHPEEYAKYKQVALIGRKTGIRAFMKEEMLAFRAKYSSIDNVEELPVNYEGELIEVKPSESKDVTLFGCTIFDPKEAQDLLIERGNDLDKVFSQYASTPEYVASDIGRPPIPPKNDSMYLLSVCGVGSGKAGTEGDDLHLQRGIAEVIEEKVSEVDETGTKKSVVDKVTTRTAIKMTLIQSNGEITHLM